MPLRLGVLLGARANAWHTDVLKALPSELEPTVIGTRDGRYPTDEIGLPFVALPWDNQVGPGWRRRLRNLRYRLLHRFGDDFRLAPAGDQLDGFDALHSWELFTEWTRVALDQKRRRGVPVAITVWDNIPGHFADDRRRGPVRRRALAEADLFYVVAERSRAALELDGVAPERIVGGAPSVDTARFRPGAEERLRAELGVGPSDVLCLCVARLEPEKGVEHLIEALAIARRRGPSEARLRLWVAGDGGLARPLRARVDALGLGDAVRFLGGRRFAEMPALYRAADLFVLPSLPTPDWQEQWGQALLEAMASEVACVGTASGAIPEVLGEAGRLLPPADPVALADAVSELARHPDRRQALAEAGRKRVLGRFTHRHQAAALAELYRRLTAAPA